MLNVYGTEMPRTFEPAREKHEPSTRLKYELCFVTRDPWLLQDALVVFGLYQFLSATVRRCVGKQQKGSIISNALPT